jgi:hypothetical protein
MKVVGQNWHTTPYVSKYHDSFFINPTSNEPPLENTYHISPTPYYAIL